LLKVRTTPKNTYAYQLSNHPRGINRYGDKLVKLCSAYKGARNEVAERIVRIRARVFQIESQLVFLRDIASSLSPEHLSIHHEVTQVLVGKLQVAISRLEASFKSPEDGVSNGERPTLRPLKYALFKEKLDASIAALETWQTIFDPSWYLMLRSTSPFVQAKVDAEVAKPSIGKHSQGYVDGRKVSTSSKLLRAATFSSSEASTIHVFLPADKLEAMIKQDVPHSTVRLALGQTSGTKQPPHEKAYILEAFDCPQGSRIDVTARNVRDFALKLSRIKPHTFGLLCCKGAIWHKPNQGIENHSFTFVFQIPDGLRRPKSLRQFLLEGNMCYSLSERFNVALELVKSVSYVHSFGFVHKGIRPEAILLLEQETSSLGSAFLVGFDRVRIADGVTFRLGTTLWQKDLYQHPSRQGPVPEEDFMMQHDIYSLGICLLELGMWQSFVGLSSSGAQTVSKALQLPAPKDETSTIPFDRRTIKEHLVNLAQAQLPHRMGSRYTKIVVTCLTCLDRGNEDFGDEDEFKDEDGITVGVRFIEKVSYRSHTGPLALIT
jgi:hypothetical protein